MTEHKYTDEEVIKALEHCVHAGRGGYKCRECVNVTGCKPWLLREALDLINRQKAEIAFWMDAAANAKKEAVKEFAERLKHIIGFDDLVPTDCVMLFPYIDNLVKEFTEGKT